jgi:DNA-binding transcriptional LysR family regulator
MLGNASLQNLQQSRMDRFEAMEMFVSVAEAQSFVAAARRHGLSAARVTRSIAALEARLGARLLHRTTRAVRLTEAGSNYLAHCKRLLLEVTAAEAAAVSSHRELSGALTITAPRMFGRLHVTPVVTAFMKRHPAVTLRVLYSDELLDFFDQNVDVAIRIAPLPDSNMRALQVGSVRRVVCASPQYLRAHGVPQRPQELTEHTIIGFSGLAGPQAWTFAVEGKHERVQLRARLVVNTADLAIAAAVSGQGLTRLLSYQPASELAHKRLRIVLAEYELPPTPVHVLRVEGRNASQVVRAFAEFAAAQLKQVL